MLKWPGSKARSPTSLGTSQVGSNPGAAELGLTPGDEVKILQNPSGQTGAGPLPRPQDPEAGSPSWRRSWSFGKTGTCVLSKVLLFSYPCSM